MTAPPPTVTMLWEAYRLLALEQQQNETLLADLEHQKKLALAHKAWREAFLADTQ